MADIVAHRNNNKQLDLSRTIRLSGLSSGAKLELVLLSRSPSVVSVALQLPEAEVEGVPGGRLIDRFPSTTTLWLMLRKFESTSSENLAASKNFTARGVPRASDGTTSRLYYETPVLHVMGKELSSFTGLQKSLLQLGINSGSIMIRLSFRTTDSPLEQAMEKIDLYFQSANTEEQQDPEMETSNNGEGESLPQPLEPDTGSGVMIDNDPLSALNSSHLEESSRPPSSKDDVEESQAEDPKAEVPPLDESITGPNQRPISVYAAPSSTTPKAAQHIWNEQDYQPTIEDAIRHQSYLARSTQNKRLPTDAEVAAKRKEQQEKLASITNIVIKVRFPDGSSVTAPFSDVDTARSLHDFVSGLLVADSEPFMLNQSAAGGPRVIPKDGTERLIKHLGMNARELVNFLWGEGASTEARAGPILKQEYCDKAQEIVVHEIRASEIEERQPAIIQEKKDNGKERGKGGTPKWLKPFGKK